MPRVPACQLPKVVLAFKKKVWHFGCQKKSLARSLPKMKIGMIVPDILFRNMLSYSTD
jgi:hypothetical protein